MPLVPLNLRIEEEDLDALKDYSERFASGNVSKTARDILSHWLDENYRVPRTTVVHMEDTNRSVRITMLAGRVIGAEWA